MNQIDPAYVICQKSSLTRLHQRVQAINETAPRTRFTKRVGTQTVQLERQSRIITGNVEATMERIIKDFVRDYHVLIRTLGAAALADGIPPMRLCRPTLANRRSICEKTAYDHLRRLRNAGLITKYRFRGTRHAFEIWIDPTLLFQAERLDNGQFVDMSVDSATQLVNQALVTDSDAVPTANITAYKVSTIQGNLETEKEKAVDCGQGNNQGNTEQPVPQSGDSQVTMWQGERQTPIEKPSTGPRQAGGRATLSAGSRLKARMSKKSLDAKAEADRTPAQREAIQLGFVRSFWKYAQGLLYPERQFTETEHKATLTAIWQSIYGRFEQPRSELDWDRYQADLYRRLELAAGYYQRHPDKWIPAPYAQFKAGAGYFDSENRRGFSQTDQWLVENRIALAKSHSRQAVNQAIRQLRLHRTQNEKCPKTIRFKTYIDAYRTLEANMKAISPAAADRFRQLAATLDQQKPALTSGFTRNFKK